MFGIGAVYCNGIGIKVYTNLVSAKVGYLIRVGEFRGCGYHLRRSVVRNITRVDISRTITVRKQSVPIVRLFSQFCGNEKVVARGKLNVSLVNALLGCRLQFGARLVGEPLVVVADDVALRLCGYGCKRQCQCYEY